MKEYIILDNQKTTSRGAKKYFLTPDTVYGNYKTIKEVVVQGRKSPETMWLCIHIPTGEERFKRPANLAKYLTGDEQDKINNELVKENKHQIGFRNYLYRSAKTGAEKRGHNFNLTFDEYDNLIQKDCFYCGDHPRPMTEEQRKNRGNSKQPLFYYNGVDRIDSNKDYNLDNCVPCCPICNYMKHTLSQNDFYNQIVKIYNFRKLKDVVSETIENTSNIDGSEQSTSQADGDGNRANPEMD